MFGSRGVEVLGRRCGARLRQTLSAPTVSSPLSNDRRQRANGRVAVQYGLGGQGGGLRLQVPVQGPDIRACDRSGLAGDAERVRRDAIASAGKHDSGWRFLEARVFF